MECFRLTGFGSRFAAPCFGTSGYVLCPDYVQLCGAEGVHGPKRDQSDCLFPGVLRHGRCVTGREEAKHGSPKRGG